VEFHGRRFEVGPAVLIPREDTERLVQLACERLPSGARLADLGTGSGCIAITLACERPDLQITATDVSPEALETARRNARALLAERRSGLGPGTRRRAQATPRIETPPTMPGISGSASCTGTGMPRCPRTSASMRSSPIPYIAQADPHLSQGDLRHEPLGALTDGGDGLGAIRRIIAGARERLVPGGWLMLEHGWDQAGGGAVVARGQRIERRGDLHRPFGQGSGVLCTCARLRLESTPYNVIPRGSDMDAKDFIQKTVTDNPVVLFMKGTAQFPQCGFSGRAVQVLKAAGVTQMVTVNVLEDDEVRQAIKDFANWPTIPQLYINGEFVGGSDIIAEMFQNGELQKMLTSPASAG
jgi:monothiol glutaredoxin